MSLYSRLRGESQGPALRLEGNEKNLLAKFAIMDTSPGESKPVQVATESGSRKWVPGAKRAGVSEERQRPLQSYRHPLSSLFFSRLILSSGMG